MKIISIAGPARVGKNSLANHISEYIKEETDGRVSCYQIAIADKLKQELHDQIFLTHGVSVFSEDPAHKALFRNNLIDYAESKRKEDPFYWVMEAVKTMVKVTSLNVPLTKDGRQLVFIITDLRHAAAQFDDIDVLETLGGMSIYVEQYEDYSFQTKSVYPYREFELLHDEHLKRKSDITYQWVKNEDTDMAWEESPDTKFLKDEIMEYIYE